MTSSTSDVPEPWEQQLDVLIAVHQELAKQADLRRQRADAASTTLITTAITLALAIIAGANALESADQVPECAVYVSLVGLAATVVCGGVSRSGRMKMLSSDRRRCADLNTRYLQSLQSLQFEADRAVSRKDVASARGSKEDVLRLWSNRAEYGDLSVKFKNHALVWGSGWLGFAIATLMFVGISVLGHVWPD